MKKESKTDKLVDKDIKKLVKDQKKDVTAYKKEKNCSSSMKAHTKKK